MAFVIILTIFVIVAFSGTIVFLNLYNKKKFERAIDLMREGKYKLALPLLKDLYEKNPNERIYNWYLAECYENLGDIEMALVEYGKVALTTHLPKTLEEVKVHEKLAFLHLKAGHYKKAQSEFFTIVSIDPEHARAYFGLGKLFIRDGEYQRAVEYFEKAVRYNREYSEAYLELGKLQYRMNQTEKAKRNLIRAIDLDTDLTEAHYYYGLILQRNRSYEKSIQEFQEASKDERFQFDCYVQMGAIYMALAEKSNAFDFFERALALGTEDVEKLLDAKYNYANYLVHEGSLQRALDLWSEIYKVKPDYKDVENKLTVYGEISKSYNLTRFITSLKHEFIEITKKICTQLNIKVEKQVMLKEDLAEITGDFIIGKEGLPVIVHIAKWTTLVGEIPVRELLERMTEVGAGRAIFVTSSDFSERAYDLSKIRPLELINRKELEKILSKIYS